LHISLTTTATDEQLNTLKTDLDKYCPVAKVFAQSGSNVITEWLVTRP